MKKNLISRRKFLGVATAVTALSSIPFNTSFGITQKSKSIVSGVKIGNITNNLARITTNIDDFIGLLLDCGINSVELRFFAEESLGIPRGPQRGPGGPGQRQMTEEVRAAQQKAMKEIAAEQRKWRLSLPMSKYEEMRNKFDKAKIRIHIVKFAPSAWSDEEIDYAFKAAKILGAYGISDEATLENSMRLGKFAEKHKSLAIYHTHGQFSQPDFNLDTLLSYSTANMLNFDVGHYFGSTGLHPNAILEKYHDRIPSIHIKDKTGPNADPANTNKQFGQGQTPLKEVLTLIRDKEWPINCDIELEYPIPEGSDTVKEIKKCIEYLNNILES
jgi:sugar phosphate isomerase/epimerase